MGEFKVGDRVKVYGYLGVGDLPSREGGYFSGGYSGTVTGYACDCIYVKLDAGIGVCSNGDVEVHYKQCRKLVKKAKPGPKEIWVNIYEDGFVGSPHPSKEAADGVASEDSIACVHYVRAKNQKVGK